MEVANASTAPVHTPRATPLAGSVSESGTQPLVACGLKPTSHTHVGRPTSSMSGRRKVSNSQTPRPPQSLGSQTGTLHTPASSVDGRLSGHCWPCAMQAHAPPREQNVQPLTGMQPTQVFVSHSWLAGLRGVVAGSCPHGIESSPFA